MRQNYGSNMPKPRPKPKPLLNKPIKPKPKPRPKPLVNKPFKPKPKPNNNKPKPRRTIPFRSSSY